MGRFNGHFSSFFRGCAIVGRHKDVNRNRNVTVYALPNDPGIVGIYDGIDTWVTAAECSTKEVRDNMAKLAAGESLEIEVGQTRSKVPGAFTPTFAAQAPKPRRSARTPVPPPSPQPTIRERRSAR